MKLFAAPGSLFALLFLALPLEARSQELIPQVTQPGFGNIALSPDGRLLASNNGRGVSLYDVESGFLVRRLPCSFRRVTDDPRHITIRTYETDAVAFSPDGTVVAAMKGEWARRATLEPQDGWIYVPCAWDVATGNDLRAEELRFLETPEGSSIQGFPFELREPLMWQVVRDGALAKRLARYQGPATVLSPDGRLGASVRSDDGLGNVIEVWELESGELRFALLGHERSIGILHFHPRGRWLASLAWPGELKLWDLTTGEEREIPTDERARDIRFSPDGRWFVAGGDSLQVFDSGDWTKIRDLAVDRSEPVDRITFSDDGLRLAAVSSTGQGVRIWSTSSWKELRRFDSSGLVPVTALDFHPSGVSLAVGTMESELGPSFPWRQARSGLTAVWPLNGNAPPPLRLREDMTVWGVRFSPDGRRLVTASEDTVRAGRLGTDLMEGQLRLWELGDSPRSEGLLGLGSGDPEWKPRLEPGSDLSGEELTVIPEAGATDAHFSPDGRFIVAAIDRLYAATWEGITRREYSPNGMLMVWDLESRGWRYSIDTGFPFTQALAIDPAGNRIASGHDELTVVLYDFRKGAELWRSSLGSPNQGSRHQEPVQALAFHPDGEQLVAASWTGLTVLDVHGSREPLRVESPDGGLSELAFTPDGTGLVTGSCIDDGIELDPDATGSLRLWSTAAWNPTRELGDGCVTALAFTTDGRLLAAGYQNGVVELRRKSDWEIVTSLAILPNSDGWIVWTPDGSYDGNPTGIERMLAVRRGRGARALPRNGRVPGLLQKVMRP